MKKRGTSMGRITVSIEIANYLDVGRAAEGTLDPAKIRRTMIQAVVDPGATKLVLPKTLVEELALPPFKSKVKVAYADGRRGVRKETGGVFLSLQGRSGVFTAIVEPKRTTALIGAIVLEDLDFLVDCAKQRLVPRDPDYILSEMSGPACLLDVEITPISASHALVYGGKARSSMAKTYSVTRPIAVRPTSTGPSQRK
jgi:predicted aspartyl protease